MRDLPKLARSRDETGKVDNIHSNLTHLNLEVAPPELGGGIIATCMSDPCW